MKLLKIKSSFCGSIGYFGGTDYRPVCVSYAHIMEGYLHSLVISSGSLVLPFAVVGLMRIKKIVARIKFQDHASCPVPLSLSSSLKIPSVTGSSSHPTGVGLGQLCWSVRYQRFRTICLLFKPTPLGSRRLDYSGCQCILNGSGWSDVGYFDISLLNPMQISTPYLSLSVQ